MKHVFLIISLLFFFLSGSINSFAKNQTEPKKPQKKQKIDKKSSGLEDEKSLENEKQKAVLNEIQNNLSVLKFDTDPVSRKRALNYLFDHFKDAEPFLYEEIMYADNTDLFLSNILELLITSEKPADKEKLLASSLIHLNKTIYSETLLNYLYPDYSNKVISLTQSLFDSNRLSQKIVSLNLISQLKIKSLKQNVLKSVQTETNGFLLFLFLQCLSNFKLENQELQLLLPLFSSDDTSIRIAVRRIFCNYPEMTEMLIHQFNASENLFEQLSLIETLTFYPNQAAENFLISILKNNEFTDKALDSFFQRKKIFPATLNQLFDFFYDDENEKEYTFRNALLRVLVFTYFNFEEKEQKLILDFFLKNLKESNDSELIFSLLSQFYSLNLMNNDFKSALLDLEKKYSGNWRIAKMIFQILDLKP